MMRAITTIAADIGESWTQPTPQAQEHLESLGQLVTITDQHRGETGIDIVLGFLNNAFTWRGEDAARIKRELHDHVDLRLYRGMAIAEKERELAQLDAARAQVSQELHDLGIEVE
jgi:hypothetical protein